MSTAIKTVGHRLAQLGYHPAYQGKWHLSHDLDTVADAVDAPMAAYRKIIEGYGFRDFLGFGDVTDTTLGGYNYDEATTAFAARWLRSKGTELNAKGTPWYLAVNFVNPHDVMYVNSDLPGETVQGKYSVEPIARPPQDEALQSKLGRAAATDAEPALRCRGPPFRSPSLPRQCRTCLSGNGRTKTARWRVLRDYYFNCIRDCDRQVVSDA